MIKTTNASKTTTVQLQLAASKILCLTQARFFFAAGMPNLQVGYKTRQRRLLNKPEDSWT